MKLTHEIIQKSDILPFHAFTFKAKNTERIIPQHWHQSTELIYCLQGSLDVWLNGVLYSMHPNDILLINSNTIHSTQSPIRNHVLCIQFPLPFLQTITENQFNHNFIFNLNTVKSPSSKSSALYALLNHLVTIVDSSDDALPLATLIEEQALVLQLLSILVRSYSVKLDQPFNHRSSNTFLFMDKVTTYINDNFYEQLSLHQIANHFNYSDSYFSRIFKSTFDMNFHDFLVSVRLNDAVKQLIKTDNSIELIALNCGFKSYRNFYNTFVEVYQISPKQYRFTTLLKQIIPNETSKH
ncbi:AraC family transcriptional regulator [Lapidilactobacillus dextrinicus]|uniref:AraC family transcriptional regulator n=1 Tax=Lapidilactobacillus dextrinicus TaxID=51664 RepID=UPI0022E65DAB|nr:AraC family transcriptional regulator [Lapidilactobacillus dextrinicus]